MFDEFCDVLRKNGIIAQTDMASLKDAKPFVTLYAIACMHGSTIQLDDPTNGQLLAGYANRQRHLEVKVQIHFDDAPKPIFSPVCMFLTSLKPEDHCEAALLALGTDWHPHVWSDPLEINADGKLAPIG